MLNFKEALKEIFEAEMVSGGSLKTLCDAVLTSSVAPLPKNVNKFILLGDYAVTDVRVGELKKKFREVELELDCGAVIRQGRVDTEQDAEEAAYLIAKTVRTILRDNKKLVSTTYPDGLAIVSEPLDESLSFIIFDQVPVAMNTVSYYAKIVESD